MNNEMAIAAFSALAHESRLAVFRLLVETGPGGVAAGDIAERIGLPSTTLSFHLKELSRAGLIRGRPQGRFVVYAPDFDAMNALIAFMTENCCQGSRDCAEGEAVACAPRSKLTPELP